MSWIFYALLTPILFSFTNVTEKYLIEKRIKNPIFLSIIYGLFYFVVAFVLFIFHGFIFLPTKETILIISSGIFLDFYLVPYFKALAIEETSRVIPLFQIIPVFALILSFIFLGEVISIKQFVGLCIVLIASFVISAEKLDFSILKPRKSFWYMMFSSLLYTIAAILFKFTVIHVNFLTTFEYQSIGTGIGGILLLLYKPYKNAFTREVKIIPKHLYLIISGLNLIGIIGELATSYAYFLAPVALVTVVGGTQPLFVLLLTVLLSYFFPSFLKEDIRKETIGFKLITIIAIGVGIILIAV